MPREFVNTLVNGRADVASPLNPSLHDIKREFAKFYTPSGTPKDVVIADKPVCPEFFLVIDDCFNVFERQFSSIPVIQLGNGVRPIGFYYYSFEEHARAGMIPIVRLGWQLFTQVKTIVQNFRSAGVWPQFLITILTIGY